MDTIEVYEVLVKQHEKMLFAYVLGFTRNYPLAEEIVQEAFVIAYRKLSTLKNKERFGAWLRVIARNLALRELKKQNREIAYDPEVLQGMEDVFEPLDAAEEFEDRLKVVEHCFEQLPEKMRQVCGLHYFEGKSTAQIALALQIGLMAVLKRLERSRDAIRQCAERGLKLEQT